MNKGYFAHNVFKRTDACNQTTIYFKEDQVRERNYFLKIKLVFVY